MEPKARLSSYCTKRANNGVNLVTSRKINTRLARPIVASLPVTILKGAGVAQWLCNGLPYDGRGFGSQ